ncbi:MAG: arsenate reductase (glutaredoxin) [Corynebacterium sp.]|uniref:arsenate reductase (glutaredoxin) n=1 Tax=Corynebacterium sp. TaxID=1720 RepID=UPI0026E0B0B6|nr:arsenate reductase (glutaredoxin) [Corynebacterium sp.]MDO5668664.1 arsenate reductase (glutaredoxin) [Corynebacterium sp.]
MNVTIYHNPRCSKSRQALAYLRERDLEPEIIRYLDDTPDVDKLKELIDAAGVTAHDAIRTREAEYAELGLSPETPEAELLAAMAQHPRLIERPFVVTDRGVRIARPTEAIDDII